MVEERIGEWASWAWRLEYSVDGLDRWERAAGLIGGAAGAEQHVANEHVYPSIHSGNEITDFYAWQPSILA